MCCECFVNDGEVSINTFNFQQSLISISKLDGRLVGLFSEAKLQEVLKYYPFNKYIILLGC